MNAIFKTIEKCIESTAHALKYFKYEIVSSLASPIYILFMHATVSKHLCIINPWGYAPNLVSIFLKPNWDDFTLIHVLKTNLTVFQSSVFISMIFNFKLNAHICLLGSDDFCYSHSLTTLHSEKRAPWVYLTKDYTTVKLTNGPLNFNASSKTLPSF